MTRRGPTFTTLPTAAIGAAFEALGLNRSQRNWAGVLCFLWGYSRRADRLGGLERDWVMSWLAETGRHGGLEDVWAAQVSLSQLDGATGHSETTRRALSRLHDLGLVETIHKGIKGHSTLYAIGPVKLDSLTFEGLNVGEGENTLTFGENTLTFEGEYTHVPTAKPQENETYPESSINYPDRRGRGENAAPPRAYPCPDCGNALDSLGNCGKCGISYALPDRGA